jgi:hypothetical protein
MIVVAEHGRRRTGEWCKNNRCGVALATGHVGRACLDYAPFGAPLGMTM